MTEQLNNVIARAKQLCEWIGQTPHQRGSINGLAAQVGHELRALTTSQPAQAGEVAGEWFCGNCRVPVPAPTQPAAQATPEPGLLKTFLAEADRAGVTHLPATFAATLAAATPPQQAAGEPVGEQISRAEAIRLINAMIEGDTLPPSSLELLRELTRPAPGVPEDVQRNAERYRAINTPEIEDFLAAVHNEALHQRERWYHDQDAGKADADWLWLLGYLAGKALHAQTDEKRLHHIITTAAACLNWHAARVGAWASMRPGIDPAAHALAAAQAKGGQA